MRHILIIVSIFLFSFTIISCAKKSSTDDTTTTTDNTTTTTDTTAPDFTVSEITQTVGSDGLLTGSFVVPEDGISFLLSIFLDNNNNIKFYSLTDPDGTDILVLLQLLIYTIMPAVAREVLVMPMFSFRSLQALAPKQEHGLSKPILTTG